MGAIQSLIGGSEATPVGGLVQFTDVYVESVGTTNQTAGYRVNTSGNAEKRVKTVYTTHEVWRLLGASADYEVRAVVTDGALIAGTAGTYLLASTSPEWSVSSLVSGEAENATLAMDARRVSDGAPLDSWTVTLFAQREA